MSSNSAETGVLKYEDVVVAVDLSTAVAGELGKASTALRRTVNPLQMQVFWVPPTAVHVSLLYTARVREDLLPLVVDAVRLVAREAAPFSIRVKGLKLREEAGAQGEAVVKAIWANVTDGAEQLAALREKLKTSLAELDVETDAVTFLPHVPLGLLDQYRAAREFGSSFVEWQEKDFGSVPVNGLQVKRATPVSGGEKPFGVLADVPLGPGGNA